MYEVRKYALLAAAADRATRRLIKLFNARLIN